MAISDNANRIGASIRAELRDEETESQKAEPILEPIEGVSLFTTLPARGYIRGVAASPDALEKAEEHLVALLKATAYE